jgi:putative membrane protein
MGAADIVPGVSGGTVALVLGIYERLVASIRAGSSALGSLVRLDLAGAKTWLRQVEWALILPLGTGILIAVALLASLLERLLHDQAEVMAALFLGLVAGSAVVAWKLLTVRDGTRLAILVVTGIATFFVLGLTESTSAQASSQIAAPALWAFFGAGAIAICAMILPGISGSFVLVMLGMYSAVLGAVTDRDFLTLGVFLLGAVVGLALFSQLLHRALRDHYNAVMAVLIGLMLGSLRVLWPWPHGVESTALGAPDDHLPAAVAVAVLGLGLVIGIDALGRRIAHRSVAEEVEELTAD